MRRVTIAGIKRRSGELSAGLARRWGAIPPVETPDEHSASFDRWASARSSKLKQDYPSSWIGAERPQAPHPSLAVVIHVHYPELLPEIIGRLEGIPVRFDLLARNSSEGLLELAPEDAPGLRETMILDVPNHGRDILPLVALINAGLLDPYELVLKVHTKKSPWRANHPELNGTGEAWRSGFVSSLLGSEDDIRDILSEFALDPSLGLLTAPGSIVGPEHWGGDREIVRDLLLRLQLRADDRHLEFASGSMYWCRGFVLQALRGLDLRPDDFEPEQGQIDGTTAHGVERLIGIVTREAGYTTRDTSTLHGAADAGEPGWSRYLAPRPSTPRARAMPFYLPQFHTFPENDLWWGDGFTEWSNVAAAKPVYRGHNQPLLPGELGFYDLTDSDVRREQYALALQHGLTGFMYYYYWFAGTTLMTTPIESLVREDHAHPFCIMWANENWTRRWDGSEADVLIAQDYDEVPAARFIHDVMHLITDPRYLRVDGRPLIAVYKITQIPDFESVTEYWREQAVEAGLPGLELVTVDVGTVMGGIEGPLADSGLDSYLEFAPHNMYWDAEYREPLKVHPLFEGNMMNYGSMAQRAEERLLDSVEEHRYPGVMVNFDNTARRQWRPDLWVGSNPYTFRRWLNSAVDAVMDREPDRRLVFINAWNEWAESAVLEPSQRWGRAYLLAARDVLIR